MVHSSKPTFLRLGSTRKLPEIVIATINCSGTTDKALALVLEVLVLSPSCKSRGLNKNDAAKPYDFQATKRKEEGSGFDETF